MFLTSDRCSGSSETEHDEDCEACAWWRCSRCSHEPLWQVRQSCEGEKSTETTVV